MHQQVTLKFKPFFNTKSAHEIKVLWAFTINLLLRLSWLDGFSTFCRSDFFAQVNFHEFSFFSRVDTFCGLPENTVGEWMLTQVTDYNEKHNITRSIPHANSVSFLQM
jgi:hypothetical protein